MYNLFLIVALSLVPYVNSQAFSLNTASYPTVGDHHCIAWYCDRVLWDSDGYHRDDQSTYARRRRHAMGCDGVTICGSGDSCDEIPYASTYDGGIGCFATRWTQSGRSINSLATHGSHMCVRATDNSAHGSALSTFYNQQHIGNFGRFVVVLPTNNQGCTSSGWCNRLRRANHGISGETLAQACTAARFNGKQYRHITTSQYTTFPRCPSRGYRRDEEDASFEDREVTDPLSLEERADETTSTTNVTNVPSPRVIFTDSKKYYIEMFGSAEIGDTIWDHDESLVNGTTSKVVQFLSYDKAFGSGHLQARQKCE